MISYQTEQPATPYVPEMRVKQHLSCIFTSLLLCTPLYAGPQSGNITLGDGRIEVDGSITSIHQDSNRMAIEWGSFNTASDETVNFIQPHSSALALNVDYSGLPSQLLGNINANGQVLILNQHGILIGESASIQVGSLLASDLSVDINDFAEGNFTLFDENHAAGGVRNLGEIQTFLPSGVYLLGQFVDNQGSIFSSNGHQHLGVADTLIVYTSSDGMVGVEVSKAMSQDISDAGNLINNTGDIVAFNGNIYLDVYYADNLKAEAVNNQGMVSAIAITDNSGQIFLTPQTSTDQAAEDLILEVEAIVSENQSAESGTGSAPIVIEITPKPKASLDVIMPSCTGTDMGEQSCQKYNAIKRYLGRLLLGGSLPEPE